MCYTDMNKISFKDLIFRGFSFPSSIFRLIRIVVLHSLNVNNLLLTENFISHFLRRSVRFIGANNQKLNLLLNRIQPFLKGFEIAFSKIRNYFFLLLTSLNYFHLCLNLENNFRV